jgi:SNF2 family DNA or RNA helicase
VKNRAAKAHQAAKAIRAPFRLAITGTPMENSLSDLWALLSLTASGLFPSPTVFRSEYTKPIEQPDSSEDGRRFAAKRMARLRRRIRPFMLRRTKDLVASDLPPKQEQVSHVELVPKHRRLYDQVLQRERQKVLGLLENMEENRFIIFKSLTLLRMLALDPAIVDEKYASVPSSKMEALMGQLEEIVSEGHRVIIFSQFTSFLTRVGDALADRGVAFAYLDGSTRNRSKVIEGFKTGTAPAFLISLKAGGFGLTLTEADYVFLLDPWWNPATEAQAVDRAHRIGQDRTVMVYRMVAEGTIEEKVLALQQKKAALFSSLTDGDAAFSSTITADDVRELFTPETD